MLIRWLDRMSGALRDAAGESAPVRRFFRGDIGSSGAGQLGRWRFRVMEWQERGAVFRAVRRGWERLLRTSVGSLCTAVFFAAAVCLSGRFFRGGIDPGGLSVLVPAVLLLSVLPGLGERQSLSHCLRTGRLTEPFFFGFCGLLPDSFGEDGMGRSALFPAFVIGGAVGLAGIFLPPLVLPLAGGVAAWFLLRAVPELSLPVLMLLFPFLPLSSHATAFLAVGTALSLAAFAGKWLSGRRPFGTGIPDRFALGFAAAFLLSGGMAGVVSALLCFGGWTTVRSLGGRWRARMAASLILSASLSACVGILEYFTGRATLGWVDVTRFSDIGGRVCATFSNPNILAVFLLLAYPMALCGIGCFRSTAARILSGIGAGGMALCTVLTWSRGAWLGMLAETLLFLLLFSRRSLSLLAVLPLPCAALLPFLPHSLTNRFASIGNLGESSIRYRLEVWRGIARMLAANPFGIGTREADFRHVWQNYAIPGTETVMHAHALLPQAALEVGIPGALIFVGFLVCLVRSFRPVGWSVGGFCAVCGALVMGMFDHLWYARGMLWLLFAVAALVPAGEEMS